MPIVGGLDIHRKQLTFDYPGTVTGEIKRGQIAPADRQHLRAWLARFAGRGDVAFAMEGCTGWRYLAEELAAAGIAAHLAEPAGTAAARGRKRHAKTDKTDSRHLRTLLAEGRLPECWIPPAHILEYRALLELYHDLRTEYTAQAQLRRLLPPGRPGWARAPSPRTRPGLPWRPSRITCCAPPGLWAASPTPKPAAPRCAATSSTSPPALPATAAATSPCTCPKAGTARPNG